LEDTVTLVDNKEAKSNMPLAIFGKNRNPQTPFLPYWCSEDHIDRRMWAYSVTAIKKPEHFESQKRNGE